MIATKVCHLVPRGFPHNCPLPPLLSPALSATSPETRKWGRGERSALEQQGGCSLPPPGHLYGFPSPHAIPSLSKTILNHLSKRECLQRMFQMTSKIGQTAAEGFKPNKQTYVLYPSNLEGKFALGPSQICSLILGAGIGKQDIPVRWQRI